MKEKIFFVANLVGIFILVAALITAWNYYTERKRSQDSQKEFELRKAIEAGNKQRATSIIEELKKSKTYKPLAISYEVYLKEDQDNRKLLKELVDSLKDKDLKAIYVERYAYELYRFGEKDEAIKQLEKVREESPNYLSALLLKAQILNSMGKTDQAMQVLNQVAKSSKGDSYYKNLSEALILVRSQR